MNKFIGVLLILVLAASCKKETEPNVKITTEYGDIKIRLYDKTPKHRDNFLKLVDTGGRSDVKECWAGRDVGRG